MMMVMTATTMMIPHVVSKMSTVKSCGVANSDDGDGDDFNGDDMDGTDNNDDDIYDSWCCE